MIPGLAVAAGIGYLLGSLMFAVFLSRAFHGVDVRGVGSGNPGFTNVYRGVNRATGLLVLVGDIAKGTAAVLIAMALVPERFSVERELAGLVAGIGALVGHAWPLFAAFRGGKGVATAAGVFAAITPAALIGAALVWTLVLGISRYMSLASVLAAIAFPLIVTLKGGASMPLLVVSWTIGVLIVLRHHTNIARLARGEERRFTLKKS